MLHGRVARGLWFGLGLSLLLGLWEVAARITANPGLFPPIGDVIWAFIVWWRSGLLVEDVAESIPRALLVLALAAPIGMTIGLALALFRPVRWMFDAPLQLLRSMPPVALLPLFVLWMGIEWQAKVFAGVFVCVFPIAITTAQAARTIEMTYRELATDLRLSFATYLRKIVIPGSLPGALPGLRLAAGTSFVMVFVSELAGADAGLGYRISLAQLSFQAALMIAGLLVLGTAGFLTDLALTRMFRRVFQYAGR